MQTKKLLQQLCKNVKVINKMCIQMFIRYYLSYGRQLEEKNIGNCNENQIKTILDINSAWLLSSQIIDDLIIGDSRTYLVIHAENGKAGEVLLGHCGPRVCFSLGWSFEKLLSARATVTQYKELKTIWKYDHKITMILILLYATRKLS